MNLKIKMNLSTSRNTIVLMLLCSLALCCVGCANQGSSENSSSDTPDSQSQQTTPGTAASPDSVQQSPDTSGQPYETGKVTSDESAYVNQSCEFSYNVPDGFRIATKQDAEIALVNESENMAVEFIVSNSLHYCTLGYIEVLTDMRKCKEQTGHDIPILKPTVSVGKASRDERMHKNYERYYADVFVLWGRRFIVSKEWYGLGGVNPTDNRTPFFNCVIAHGK